MSSCSEESDLTTTYQTINLELDNGLRGNFSEFIDKMEYFLVKTDTSDFLVSPYKIVANDSVYFIEDSFQKKIYKYNKFTGTYASIGRPGEGPEENLELDDFSVTNEGIIIHDSKLKKFLQFNFAGDFIEEGKSLYHRSIFYQGDNFKLIYSHNDPEIGSRIIRVNNNGEIKGFLKIEDWFAQKLTRDQNGFIYNSKLRKIFFLLPYTNEIAVFDEKGELIKIVKLEFGRYSFTKEAWNKYEDFNSQMNHAIENKLVFQVNSFLVLNDYYVISLNQEGGNGHLIILDHNFNLIRHFSDLINDLDNVKLSAIPWSAYGDKFLFLINSKRFINENPFLDKELPKIENSNINSFMDLYRGELFEDEYQVLVEVDLK
ncbi:hypothetical protein SAMN03080598_01891 [Algoriphagus boritolerans DSM 17298 = JCM 18970]|uniref:6-bladed beta-propeller protein n=2 Tax=Algoriphagus TaxID=246875 RepID=A0A1H5W0W0_9BACT|nr:hypothetical protein SAMN03080598_01891 [Algoriphagus boritolerans DSM 17298 = JCM 18970]